tara:strand:- start:531 stop:671 length:141 start_codon:yes stop_codon:yes gene_type:complete
MKPEVTSLFERYQEIQIPPGHVFWKLLLVFGILMWLHATFLRKDDE